jgi:hypothetical protein
LNPEERVIGGEVGGNKKHYVSTGEQRIFASEISQEVPTPPLVCISWREGKALGCEEGKALGNGLIRGYETEERS